MLNIHLNNYMVKRPRFLKPPGKIKIGLRNREFQEASVYSTVDVFFQFLVLTGNTVSTIQLRDIGLDLTFSMQEMLLRDIVEALLDTRDQMVKFARRRAKVNSQLEITLLFLAFCSSRI